MEYLCTRKLWITSDNFMYIAYVYYLIIMCCHCQFHLPEWERKGRVVKGCILWELLELTDFFRQEGSGCISCGQSICQRSLSIGINSMQHTGVQHKCSLWHALACQKGVSLPKTLEIFFYTYIIKFSGWACLWTLLHCIINVRILILVSNFRFHRP